MSELLERIVVSCPAGAQRFANQLIGLLGNFGHREDQRLRLSCSRPDFLPRIELELQSRNTDCQASFVLANGEEICVEVINITGKSQPNPQPYEYLEVETISSRLSKEDIRLLGIDHLGINLPWFGDEIHPQIQSLRERLSTTCLYHGYPSGEPWDFILPGKAEEIKQSLAVDYDIIRRPKFELVSFNKASTPIIQLDMWTNTGFEALKSIFPQALSDDQLRNIWLYLANPYEIDICLVLNELPERDWSNFFMGCRL